MYLEERRARLELCEARIAEQSALLDLAEAFVQLAKLRQWEMVTTALGRLRQTAIDVLLVQGTSDEVRRECAAEARVYKRLMAMPADAKRERQRANAHLQQLRQDATQLRIGLGMEGSDADEQGTAVEAG